MADGPSKPAAGSVTALNEPQSVRQGGNVYIKNNRAGEERKRQMHETKLISERFPEVSRIVVKMEYSGNSTPTMVRTLNFLPGSHAFFKMTCLGEGCDDGGLDLTGIVTSMIRNHRESGSGSLFCDGSTSNAVHSDMSYQVSITYT